MTTSLRELWLKREAAEATLIDRSVAYPSLTIKKLKSLSAGWDKLARADRAVDLWLKHEVAVGRRRMNKELKKLELAK